VVQRLTWPPFSGIETDTPTTPPPTDESTHAVPSPYVLELRI
jgi:hypothetical protein